MKDNYLPEEEIEEEHHKSKALQVLYHNRMQSTRGEIAEDETRKVGRNQKNNDLVNYTWCTSI